MGKDIIQVFAENAYLIWLGLFIILIVIEILTVGLTTIWFAGGSLAAMLAALLGAGAPVQILVFLAVSCVLLIFTRPWAVKHLNRKRVKTNYESEIGKVIKLTETVNNLDQTGKSTVNGQEWTVRSRDDREILEAGSLAKVIAVSGVKLIVEKFAMHIIKVEGHTDNVPAGGRYPSNWELSAARSSSIVRYLINKFKILPEMFTVIGYADTRPAEPNKPNKAKDRRVEIIVQRNNLKNMDHYQNTYLNMGKEEQLRRRNEQIQILKQLESGEIVGLDEDVKHYSGIAQPGKAPTEKTNDFIDETKRINEMENLE